MEAHVPQRPSEQERQILGKHIFAGRLGACQQQILPAQDRSDRLLPDLFAIVEIDRLRDASLHRIPRRMRRAKLCCLLQERLIHTFLPQKLFQISHLSFLMLNKCQALVQF